MSRSYKGVRVKKNRVYSVEDLQRIYSVSANTVSNWVAAGLHPSDRSKPYVFRGAFVSQFHQEKRARSTKSLRPGEFKCTGCKSAVFPDMSTISGKILVSGTHMYFGRCSECDAHVRKISSQADRDFVARYQNPNTTVDCSHEENQEDPGGIWNKQKNIDQSWPHANDRIVYKWQTYAGRFDEKTTDRHLAAIRFCEGVTNGKLFSLFTIEDVSKVRDELKQYLSTQDDRRRSKSTIAHTVSHLTAFFDWLLKQDGYKRLPKDLPDYFRLPKAAFSASLPQKAKEFPSLEEAEELLRNMPSRSPKDRRARAIFALAFLGALRADTLISLRICHFDAAKRRIVQDATVVRSKNGKSLNINWFPVPESFSVAVREWVEALERAGFAEQDALFPSNAWLESGVNPNDSSRDPVAPMSTKHAVTEAFAIACRDNSIKYTPHSAKHTIAAERDARPLTQEQRKAWSENLGHENEQITQAHYGKLSDARRAELFEDIGASKSGRLADMTDEKKVALFNRIVAEIEGN